MSERYLLGDATAALTTLLGLDLDAEPAADLASLRTRLQRAALDEVVRWDRQRLATRDYDTAQRARRWSRAIESAWELAALELDVALGARRAGVVA